MIDKIAASVADALAGVQDGATVLIGGFGTAGTPGELIDAIVTEKGVILNPGTDSMKAAFAG